MIGILKVKWWLENITSFISSFSFWKSIFKPKVQIKTYKAIHEDTGLLLIGILFFFPHQEL